MKVYEISNTNSEPKAPSPAQTPPQAPNRKPKQPRSRRRLFGIIFIVIVVLLFGAYHFLNAFLKGTTTIFSNGQSLNVNNIFQSTVVELKGEDTGRTNFMIYGLTLDENRTDTMMLASYYWKENKLVTLNIPRDLYTTYQGYQGKIVSLYAVAKGAEPDDQSYPPQYVSDFISKEYNIPIDYWVVVNMKAFVELVNDLGGVTINVPDSFTDCLYPNANYTGYIRPCPSFTAGVQTMDGATALIYARSRHSPDNNEGTDFARSRRQEQVIGAILTKLKDQGILQDANKFNTYMQIFSSNVYTNLTPAEMIKLADVGQGLDPSRDYSSVNWSYDSGFLCNAQTPDGQDILLYGAIGDCDITTGAAGIGSASPYRQIALNYVQNLLQSAESASGTPPSISTTTPSGLGGGQ